MSEEVCIKAKGQTKRKRERKDVEEETVAKKLKGDVHPEDHDIAEVVEQIGTDPAWTEDEMRHLITRVEELIPKDDLLPHMKRIEKINWEKVKFEPFSKEECREKCVEILSKLRKFRTLGELLVDAKDWVKKPWKNYNNKKKNNHPDKPHKPLTSYLLFYLEKRPKLAKRHPEMKITELTQKISEKFKSLPPDKKQKYVEKSLQLKEEYIEKLKKFNELHPELVEPPNLNSRKKPNPSGLIRPPPPFKIYCDKKMKKYKEDENFDQKAFVLKCKEKWNKLSDEKKFVWIKWAFEKEAEYLENLKVFEVKNPDQCSNSDYKSILNKEERNLYDKMTGKPQKPPRSAYSLFMSINLKDQAGIDKKTLMKELTEKWKSLSNIDKKEYVDRLKRMQEKYESEYASYLSKLPEDRRKLELDNNKATADKLKMKQNQRSKHKTEMLDNALENYIQRRDKNDYSRMEQLFKDEPVDPPRTAKEYFIQKYVTDNPENIESHSATQARLIWQNLNEKKKMKYKKELCSLKERYIRDYEQFLKKMGPKELQEYSNFKKLQNNSASDDDDDDDNEVDDEDDDDDDDNSDSDSSREQQNSMPAIPGSTKEYYIKKYVKEHPNVSESNSAAQARSSWEKLSDKKKSKLEKEFDELRREAIVEDSKALSKKKVEVETQNLNKSQLNNMHHASDVDSEDSDESDSDSGSSSEHAKYQNILAKIGSPIKSPVAKKVVETKLPSSSDDDSDSSD